MNEQELTARQQATTAIRDGQAALQKAHERERMELAQEVGDSQKLMELHRIDISGQLQEIQTAAIRKAIDRDVLLTYSTTQIVAPEILAKMRQAAGPGEMPMVVIARVPIAGEKQPQGPVFAIVDLTQKLGW